MGTHVRPVQPTQWRVLLPNPIEYNTAAGITLESATGLSAGDIVYAENDTWELTDVTGAVIECTRQIYTCLEDGLATRYQADITRDYVTLLSKTGPSTIMGRVVAIYVDGVCEYVGRITDLTQRGRAWKVRTVSIFNCLTESINSPNVGIRLRYNWNYNSTQWTVMTKQSVGGGWQILPDTYAIVPTSGRGGSAEQLINDTAQGFYFGCSLSIANGFRWQGDDLNPETRRNRYGYPRTRRIAGAWQRVEMATVDRQRHAPRGPAKIRRDLRSQQRVGLPRSERYTLRQRGL